MQKVDVTDMIRKRSPNFTKKENRVLAELVQVYEEQIECKKTDHASNLGKLRAWQELAKDFNARLGGDPYRTATVLKSRLENIKKDIRRDLRKKHRGTNTDSQDTEVNPLESSEDIQEENIDGYAKNGIDEDSEMETAENIESEMDIKEIIRVKLMTDDTMDEEDFERYVTQSVKNESANQSVTQTQVQKLPETVCWTNNSNPELMDLQKKCFLEEHKLKLKHMKEMHDLEMEMIRIDHKERIKLMQQEHDTKMEMLELEKSVGIINKI